MPLSETISVPKEHYIKLMVLHFIAYLKTFIKPILLVLTGGVLAFWNESILLQLDPAIDVNMIGPVAKGISAAISIVLSAMGGFYAHSRWVYGRRDQYMKEVDWLIEHGFLNKGAEPEEIAEAIAEHRKVMNSA